MPLLLSWQADHNISKFVLLGLPVIIYDLQSLLLLEQVVNNSFSVNVKNFIQNTFRNLNTITKAETKCQYGAPAKMYYCFNKNTSPKHELEGFGVYIMHVNMISTEHKFITTWCTDHYYLVDSWSDMCYYVLCMMCK
jgi:hypothetical protein